LFSPPHALLFDALAQPEPVRISSGWNLSCNTIGLLCGENCVIPTSTVFRRPYGRAYATVLRLSYVVCNVCIVAKRCILEQKLLLTAYKKLYMRNRLEPQW